MRSKSGAVPYGVFVREIASPVSPYAMANIVFTLARLLVGVRMDRQSLTASQAAWSRPWTCLPQSFGVSCSASTFPNTRNERCWWLAACPYWQATC